MPRKPRDDYYRDRRRRKVCAFCADKSKSIVYKEVNRLRRYVSERAKIEPRRKTLGVSEKGQDKNFGVPATSYCKVTTSRSFTWARRTKVCAAGVAGRKGRPGGEQAGRHR
jgi:ribosomal protein S18